MGVSRGFRRLSVLAAFSGAAVLMFLWVNQGEWPEPLQAVEGLAVLAGLPAIFMLILGWAVAGFRQPN